MTTRTGIFAVVLATLLALSFWGGWSWKGALFDAYIAEQKTLAVKQTADNELKDKAYEQRILDADTRYLEANTILDALRKQPVPQLVCHAARSISVPSVPASAGTGTASHGVLPQPSGEGFDPSPGVIQHANEADDVVEQCRVALAKWPS